ncbi:hypothetical protein AVEN_133451-1 [Araneus ventricosus]|uniref:Uncharacterized protein n=1 Tax=Araneus ventricosus TaxID=182803 RepID=A0A4Y2HAJ0_ARAVE|nr:hypothetical protein AVEN_133451-1 [Araneus ventricosus]
MSLSRSERTTGCVSWQGGFATPTMFPSVPLILEQILRGGVFPCHCSCLLRLLGALRLSATLLWRLSSDKLVKLLQSLKLVKAPTLSLFCNTFESKDDDFLENNELHSLLEIFPI